MLPNCFYYSERPCASHSFECSQSSLSGCFHWCSASTMVDRPDRGHAALSYKCWLEIRWASCSCCSPSEWRSYCCFTRLSSGPCSCCIAMVRCWGYWWQAPSSESSCFAYNCTDYKSCGPSSSPSSWHHPKLWDFDHTSSYAYWSLSYQEFNYQIGHADSPASISFVIRFTDLTSSASSISRWLPSCWAGCSVLRRPPSDPQWCSSAYGNRLVSDCPFPVRFHSICNCCQSLISSSCFSIIWFDSWYLGHIRRPWLGCYSFWSLSFSSSWWSSIEYSALCCHVMTGFADGQRVTDWKPYQVRSSHHQGSRASYDNYWSCFLVPNPMHYWHGSFSGGTLFSSFCPLMWIRGRCQYFRVFERRPISERPSCCFVWSRWLFCFHWGRPRRFRRQCDCPCWCCELASDGLASIWDPPSRSSQWSRYRAPRYWTCSDSAGSNWRHFYLLCLAQDHCLKKSLAMKCPWSSYCQAKLDQSRSSSPDCSAHQINQNCWP